MLAVEDLIRLDALTADMVGFLRACVKVRMNILVSGQLSSGKTTLLNALCDFLPENERIISVEETAELQFKQDAVVRLASRPPNLKGRVETTAWDLVRDALRMKPDRLVVGELCGREIWSILQATNTGYDGLLATAPSCTPHDALHRLERMALMVMGDRDRFQRAAREQIAFAFDLIVHLSLLEGGKRKVVQVVEVLGVEDKHYAMQDIFRYVQTAISGGQVQGYFATTGIRPSFADRIEAAGIYLPANLFSPARR
jgi:pilus assembly protein CpaF